AIAAVAVGGAEVLLLDEPTRGMDAESRDALEAAVADHASAGAAVLLATHDIELAARSATRAVVLGDGNVVAAGPARSVLAGSLFAPEVLGGQARYRAAGASGAAALPHRRRGRGGPVARMRATAVYVLVVVVGAGAFLYPFWLPH